MKTTWPLEYPHEVGGLVQVSAKYGSDKQSTRPNCFSAMRYLRNYVRHRSSKVVERQAESSRLWQWHWPQRHPRINNCVQDVGSLQTRLCLFRMKVRKGSKHCTENIKTSFVSACTKSCNAEVPASRERFAFTCVPCGNALMACVLGHR